MSDDNDTDRRESMTKLLKEDQPKKRKTTLNNTEMSDGASFLNAQLSQQKKNKRIKYGIIGAAVLVVVILAIVLPIVLSKKGGGDDPHIDPVRPPVLPNSTNDYYLDPFGLQNLGSSFSGVIIQKPKTLLTKPL